MPGRSSDLAGNSSLLVRTVTVTIDALFKLEWKPQDMLSSLLPCTCLASAPLSSQLARRSLHFARKITRPFPKRHVLAYIGREGTAQEQWAKRKQLATPDHFKVPMDLEGLPPPRWRLQPYIPPNFRIYERCKRGMKPPELPLPRSGAIGSGGRTAVLRAMKRVRSRPVSSWCFIHSRNRHTCCVRGGIVLADLDEPLLLYSQRRPCITPNLTRCRVQSTVQSINLPSTPRVSPLSEGTPIHSIFHSLSSTTVSRVSRVQ